MKNLIILMGFCSLFFSKLAYSEITKQEAQNGLEEQTPFFWKDPKDCSLKKAKIFRMEPGSLTIKYNKGEAEKTKEVELSDLSKKRPPERTETIQKLLGGMKSFPKYKQDQIIPKMSALGYKPNLSGVCYGIAYMAIQASLRCDIRSFVKRMEKIKKGEFNDLIGKIKNKDDLSDTEKSQKLDLMGFFDGIKMYFGDSGIKGFKGQKWQKIFKLFNKHQNYYVMPTVGKFSDIQMQDVIGAVIKSKHPIAMSFSNVSHTTSLVKGDSDSALFINHDSLSIIKANDDGARIILNAMKNKVLIVQQISLEDSLEAPDVFKTVFEKTPSNLRNESLYLAAREGHVDLVKALLKKDIDVNKAGTNNGITPLLIASYHGYTAVVKALLTERKESRYVIDVNQGRTTDGLTPLDVARTDKIKELLRNNGGKTKAEKRNRSESEEEKPLPKKVRTK